MAGIGEEEKEEVKGYLRKRHVQYTYIPFYSTDKCTNIPFYSLE